MNKSAREQLAEVIAFLRKDRRFEMTRAANLVGVPATLFVEWEKGREVPDERAWERLKTVIHTGFRSHESLWRQARIEQGLERRQEGNQPTKLTQRPFERLLAAKKVEVEPPKPAVPPTAPTQPTESPKPVSPASIPENLLGEGYDLQAAYVAINQLPPGWKTRLAAQDRAAYAKELIQQGLKTQEVIDKVREKFKVGISNSTVTDIREELKKEGKVYKPEPATPAPPKPPTTPPREVHKEPAKALPEPQEEVNEGDLRAAVEMLRSVVPNLKTFSISVDDNGELEVSYSRREKRVVETIVETSGSFKVR